MNDKNKEAVIKTIREAFGNNDYPGDDYLQGSFEGCEPYEEVGPLLPSKGRKEWENIDPELLDSHFGALNFFSEAGLRFFLPAYLIADLRNELKKADPSFVLVHGFSDLAVNHQIEERVFIHRTGKSSFVNLKRYGAMTWYDYARWRLSVFTREEAEAIVTYLKYRKDSDLYDLGTEQIDAALNLYWLERAKNAPSAESLKQHLIEEEEYLAAISVDIDEHKQ
jgi:hypothetical protein